MGCQANKNIIFCIIPSHKVLRNIKGEITLNFYTLNTKIHVNLGFIEVYIKLLVLI